MATHVLAEVLEHSAAMNGDRLVMVVLADEASKETREAQCSIALIAQHAKLSTRAVQYSLARLVAMGEITIRRAVGRGNESVYRINPLPILKGANPAPFTEAGGRGNGANSAPFSQPEKVQSATTATAEKVQSATKKGANSDTEKVQSATDTYSGSYSVVKKQNTLSSSASRSSTERAIAQALLHELNRRTFKKPGKGYPPTEANLKLVIARLRETDVDMVLKVTIRKILEWWNTDMETYLRPATLYGAQKFSQYAGQLATKLRRSDGRAPKDVFKPEQLAIVTAPIPDVWTTARQVAIPEEASP